MIATMGLPARRLEETLDDHAATDARDRFIRMAERELDRSFRLAGLILGSAVEAEDAVGDALERAWREIGRLREPDRFQAWFDRIVVNACRDALRRRGRIRFVALHEDASRKVDAFRSVLDADEAFRAMSALPADELEIVVLHFWADLTLDVVAERLDLPPGTVRSRLHRALVRMRESMARVGSAGGLR